jgi:superfamily II DNA/RNA helicase
MDLNFYANEGSNLSKFVKYNIETINNKKYIVADSSTKKHSSGAPLIDLEEDFSINALVDLLNKCPQAIIYTCFNEEQVIVSEILNKYKKKFVCVNGTSKDAPEALKKFKESKVDYLVIQIVSGNAALDFPHINNVIYYSLHDSYIYFEQSKYRIRRIGQTRECNYYYIIVKGTVENSRLRSLKNKKSFNNSEFELYKRRDNDET